ncbi:MAG: c-type cytochrome biogenesis protein CcsB [Frankiaceae bacterium]
MPVDLGLARLSDNLLFVAVVCYSLALLGYAAEFAFRRRRLPEPAHQRQPEPALVGAGGFPVAGPVAGEVGAADGLGAPRSGASAVELGGGDGDRAATGPGALAVQAGGGGDRAAVAGKIAVALTIAGWLAHVGSLVARGLATHRVPWGNMYEFSSAICLVAVTTFLVLMARQPVRYLGAFVMLPVVCYLGLAGKVLYTSAGPLVPALNSYWIKIHVVAAIIASGIFMVGAASTVLYLVKERWERRQPLPYPDEPVPEVPGVTVETRAGVLARLPAAEVLDRTAYRVIAFAFPIWTFAIIAGAIWAEAAWGRYWGWDPKETWSFITWVIYAGYLHARATAGWRGRRAALVALTGFAALFIDYYVVNIWITGLHSYAGV